MEVWNAWLNLKQFLKSSSKAGCMAGCGTTAAYIARFSQVKVESFLPQAEQSRGGDERRTEGSASAEEADVEAKSAHREATCLFFFQNLFPRLCNFDSVYLYIVAQPFVMTDFILSSKPCVTSVFFPHLEHFAFQHGLHDRELGRFGGVHVISAKDKFGVYLLVRSSPLL